VSTSGTTSGTTSGSMSVRPPSLPPPLLRVNGLRAGFGGNAVLHGVGFEVPQGSITAVLGLNGAGKSVTLKVIAGLVPAWGGQVQLEGEDVTGLSPEARVAAGLGHVPQGRQVFPQLTVEENLRLGAYLLRRRDRRRYDDVLADLLARFPRLAERRRQMAGTLSGGEQAMLAVARALVNEPKLLLVDEPTAGLAPSIVEELAELLREVNLSGVTILLVEQHIAFALAVAQRAEVLQHGRVVASAPVDELDRDNLAALLGIGRLMAGTIA
jgi:branched-chain amino acid transport system ATP-binding protein